jgi:hypothetical protein
MLRRAKHTLKKVFDLNRFQQGALTVTTAAASAAVLYAVYPPALVVCGMIVILVHEFGHYFTAIGYTDAALPLFIPAGLFVFGMTMVMPLKDKLKMIEIYQAGPKWGMIASAIIAIVGLLISSPAIILSGISLGCCELYSITLGSDGRRIRQAKQALNT